MSVLGELFVSINWLFTAILLSPVQVTAPYLHVGAIAAMVLLSWPVALHAFRMRKKGTVALLYALQVQLPPGTSVLCFVQMGEMWI